MSRILITEQLFGDGHRRVDLIQNAERAHHQKILSAGVRLRSQRRIDYHNTLDLKGGVSDTPPID